MKDVLHELETLKERLHQQDLSLLQQSEEISSLRDLEAKRQRHQQRLRYGSLVMALLVGVWCFATSSPHYTLHAAGVPTGDALFYAGTLQVNGLPVNGNESIVVQLYDAPTGGNVRCSATATVTLRDGNFRLPLGNACVAAVSQYNNLYAQVNVRGTPIVGRNKLAAVPYAIEAHHAVSATTALNAPNYYTKADSDGRYYTKADSDGRYYTKSDSDGRYYTKSDSDGRYYTKADSDGRFAKKFSCYYIENSCYHAAYSNCTVSAYRRSSADTIVSATCASSGNAQAQTRTVTSNGVECYCRDKNEPSASTCFARLWACNF